MDVTMPEELLKSLSYWLAEQGYTLIGRPIGVSADNNAFYAVPSRKGS